MTQKNKAEWLLLFATVLWGATFAIVKNAMTGINPDAFVALRFILASLVFLPLVVRILRHSDRSLVYSSLILGMLNAGAYLTQTMSLTYISSARSAFITGASVILVPLIGWLFRTVTLEFLEVLSAILCFLGLFILTGAELSGLTYGDLLAFLCASFYACEIVYLQVVASKVKQHQLLCFYQMAFTIPLPFILAGTSLLDLHVLSKPAVWGALLFCGIIATILPFMIQTHYQRFTTPQKAVLIFALEPVFASLFAAGFNHEPLTRDIITGGALMLLSLTLPAWIKWARS